MSIAKIILAVPSTGTWEAAMAISVAATIVDLQRPLQGYEEHYLKLISKTGSSLPQMRQQFVEQALAFGATHLFCVDSDQVFPAYTLRKLLSWDKPVVACNVATKRFPSAPTARLWCEGNREGVPLLTLANSGGLERVWRIGTGIMLIQMDVFKQIQKPWFPGHFDATGEHYVGEDWAFCERCQEAGIELFVDQALSWQIKHIGKMEYTHELVQLADGSCVGQLERTSSPIITV